MRRGWQAIAAAFLLLSVAGAVAQAAGEVWRKDFEAACEWTTDATTLPPEKLRELIARCDLVVRALESEDETVRKVYLKRVAMCRNLYVFVLESKPQRQEPPK